MPVYKFINSRSWTTFEDYWEEFDTADQKKWESVLENASYSVDESELEEFPKIAPADPSIWFELYSLINEVDLENMDERTGKDMDRDCFLYDADGNLI
ncbi:hypothetical protein [Polynucleobacter sp. P1-05-14]|uniref:hypothetical protein n=1 Tax=Polynucleobacter sp. P1-05-14 TaxID=1819732 RepID=UPI001C0C511B|nr:hypothetical protein [Polynucleobacter sp. P1-05-14]MBU3548413.1 hypothetical protein [Polynucleobacter sp. P1-05-14]